IVTPSLVIVGAPHFLSRTTLRPLGPSVTLTVFASASTPRSSALRALSLNSSCLAIGSQLLSGYGVGTHAAPPHLAAGAGRAGPVRARADDAGRGGPAVPARATADSAGAGP